MNNQWPPIEGILYRHSLCFCASISISGTNNEGNNEEEEDDDDEVRVVINLPDCTFVLHCIHGLKNEVEIEVTNDKSLIAGF